RARLLFADALTYDTETPILRVLRSTLALELSCILHDPDLIQRAVDNDALALAFQSGEPQRIVPLISAYVRIAAASGNMRKARKYISQSVSVIRQADHAGDLFALTAQYGSLADAEYAKQRLIKRTRLPHSSVAQAYLDVWETHSAIRRRSMGKAQHYAEKAAHAFAGLGWMHQQAEVLALIGKSIARVDHRAPETPSVVFGNLQPVLTNREREIAEFVLQGLTNRAIAESLEISERT